MIKAMLLYTDHNENYSGYKASLIGIVTYSQIPREGEYVQVHNNKFLGYQIKNIIYLQPNEEKIDIVLTLGSALNQVSTQDFCKIENQLANDRRNHQIAIARDRINHEHPDRIWQRKKRAFEGLETGETAETIGQELGISARQVKTIARQWFHLLRRIKESENE